MKRILLLIACVVTVAACGSDTALPNPTGEGTVRMINAVPGSPPIRFLVEEEFMAAANYKETALPSDRFAELDDFSYRFNFEIAFPGQPFFTRVASTTLKVEKDRDHIFVLTGDAARPTVTVWDGDIRTFSESDTVLEARFSHAGAMLGDIDVYLDPVGTALGANPPAATLSSGEISDAIDYEAGEYVITVTDANDVNTVLFTSQGAELVARSAHVITVYDGDANDTGPAFVRSVTSARVVRTFPDVSTGPRVRFVHTSYETEAVDIYDDEMLTSLVVGNLPFRGVTDYLETTTDGRTYYFTPQGSTAQVLFEQEITAIPPATFTDFYVAGTATEKAAVPFVPDRAPISTSTKLSIFNGAFNFESVDVYLVERGAAVADEGVRILIGVDSGGLSPVVELIEGSYDLYLTESDTSNVISPGLPLDLVAGSVIDLLAVDTADPAVLDLVDISLP